jgi:hypothetical protein
MEAKKVENSCLLTTALGNVLINRTAKEFMHRVHPHLWVSKAPEFDYAFPSGQVNRNCYTISSSNRFLRFPIQSFRYPK